MEWLDRTTKHSQPITSSRGPSGTNSGPTCRAALCESSPSIGTRPTNPPEARVPLGQRPTVDRSDFDIHQEDPTGLNMGHFEQRIPDASDTLTRQ